MRGRHAYGILPSKRFQLFSKWKELAFPKAIETPVSIKRKRTLNTVWKCGHNNANSGPITLCTCLVHWCHCVVPHALGESKFMSINEYKYGGHHISRHVRSCTDEVYKAETCTSTNCITYTHSIFWLCCVDDSCQGNSVPSYLSFVRGNPSENSGRAAFPLENITGFH
jgi:hypothetical protein